MERKISVVMMTHGASGLSDTSPVMMPTPLPSLPAGTLCAKAQRDEANYCQRREHIAHADCAELTAKALPQVVELLI